MVFGSLLAPGTPIHRTPLHSMYEYLHGTIRQRSGTSVVVDVNGVGYDLVVPPTARFAAVGETATVWTHLVVREDAQMLYGFPRREDRELFRVLLRVRGVGPSMGLGVLAGLSPEDLVAAVVAEDLRAFTKVKGVGKKTAEQILLDLRDKTQLLAATAGVSPGGGAPEAAPAVDAAAGVLADAEAALVSIGYSDKEAAKAVASAAAEVGEEDLESIVLTAMRR